MEKLILEYIMYRLNDKNITNEEKIRLIHTANMIIDMYIMENR